MKVGDLVKMDLSQRENEIDLWGVGVIVDILDRQARGFGGVDFIVMWSAIGDVSWEMPEMLEAVSESR